MPPKKAGRGGGKKKKGGKKKAAAKQEAAAAAAEIAALPVLRFAQGARVECRVGGGGHDDPMRWAGGVVMALHYRERNWHSSRESAPYQVQLDDGPLIFAPMDDDRIVRAEGSGGRRLSKARS